MFRTAKLTCGLIATLLLGSACSGVQTLDRSSLQTITLRELTTDPSAHQEVLEAYATGKGGLILKIEAEDELPLELAIRHPLVSLDTGGNTVRFQRDMYLYLSATELLISPDGERWAKIHDMETWKELFGGFKDGRHGTLSVGLAVTAESGAAVNVVISDE